MTMGKGRVRHGMMQLRQKKKRQWRKGGLGGKYEAIGTTTAAADEATLGCHRQQTLAETRSGNT
jgi:hypothetical protein